MTSTVNSTGTSTGVVITPDSSGSLALQTAGTTAVTITSGQNVGIGTTSPSVKLEVNPPTLSGTIQEVFKITDSANSTLAIRQTTTVNDIYANNVLSLSTNGAERARIDSSGNLLFATTVSGYSNSNGINLQTNGQIITNHASGTGGGTAYAQFIYNSSQIGSITQNGTTAVAYNTSSDYRLKENIAPLTGALNKVAQLKPVTYTWKSAPDETGEGFIAHELAEVCPQAVHGTKDEVDKDGNPKYQGIDTSFLVATLTAAIQELSAKNDALTARIVALEAK